MEETIRNRLLAGAALYREMADSMAEPTARAAQLITEAFRGGHRLYVCGNGGSAGQAQHIAGEMVGRFLRERPALPCVALTTDTSILTAIANDYAADQVFSRQVEAHMRPGDVLWAITTSGNSPNVLRAAEAARARGAKVLGMTGRAGGKLKALADLTLCVPADATPAIQEGHEALLHLLCGLVEEALFGPPEKR